MNEADDITVADILQVALGIVLGLVTVGIDEPVVVGILVVIASDLLLVGSLWVRLDMGMQQTTTVAHVLDGHPRTMNNLEWAVSANLGAAQISLEERAHLGVARTTVGQDGEMQVEGEHVDQYGNNDQATDASEQVLCQQRLRWSTR